MPGNIRKRIYTCSSQEHNGELVGFKSWNPLHRLGQFQNKKRLRIRATLTHCSSSPREIKQPVTLKPHGRLRLHERGLPDMGIRDKIDPG